MGTFQQSKVRWGRPSNRTPPSSTGMPFRFKIPHHLILSAGSRLSLPKQALFIFLPMAVVLYLIFQLGYFLSPFQFPTWMVMGITLSISIIPLLWLKIWKHHRICFIMSSLILLLGDVAPAIASPLAVVLTLPNFLHLVVRHRHSRIKYLILPFILIGAFYFYNAFLLNFIGEPITISYGLQVHLGFFGAFGGFLVVYYLMYFPILLYHLALTDKEFFRTSGFLLSVLINLIAAVGFFQFVTAVFIEGIGEAGIVRVNSIMRKSTRLAPFLVISLPLFTVFLLDDKRLHTRLYWLFSLVLSILMLLLTSTRGALIAGGILWVFLFLSFLTTMFYSTKRLVWFMVISLGTWLFVSAVGWLSGVDYFVRFNPENFASGFDRREEKIDLYWDKLISSQTNEVQTVGNTLFGYGWFSERDEVVRDPHNTFISVFASFGIIGSILYYIPYLAVFLLSLYRCFRGQDPRKRPHYGMVCALILLFVVSGTVHNKLYSPIESSYTWLLISFILREDLPQLAPNRQIVESY